MSPVPRVGPPRLPLSAFLSRRLLLIAAWNAALALCAVLAVSPEVAPAARMAGAGLLVLVLPGVAWLGVFRRALDPPRLALAVVGVSSLFTVVGLTATAVGDGDPSRLRLLVVLAVGGSAGLLAFGPPRRLAPGFPWPQVAAVAAAGFVLASAASLRLVPPDDALDLEARGTAWGLAASGRPWFQTPRHTSMPLDHPVLRQAQVAESLLVTGEIGLTERSYVAARATAAAEAAGLPVDTHRGWREERAAFRADPALAGTRAPSAVLTACGLALLFELTRRLTGSRTAGIAAAALFGLAPAVLERAATAGPFAATTFALLAASLLLETPPPGRRSEALWVAAAGAWGALSARDVPWLVLGVAALAAAHAWHPKLDRPWVALLGGLLAGIAIWWAYGLSLDAAGFLDAALRIDPGSFPPDPRLFLELAAGTGHGLLPVGAVALAVWAVAASALPPRHALAGWSLAAAACTTTLALTLAPLAAAAVALAWAGIATRARTGREPLRAVPRAVAWTAAALLAASLVFDLAAGLRLLRDWRP